MIQSFEFTLVGGPIGCVAGVFFALVKQAKLGRLLAPVLARRPFVQLNK